MKRLGIVAVVLALMVAGVIGGVIGNSLGASAQPSVPNPGHSWSEIGLPAGTWPGLDADKLDGMHTRQSGTNYVPYADASGNVGVGTASPAYPLDVSGAARATDGIKIPIYSAIGPYTWTPAAAWTWITVPGLTLTFTVNAPSTLDISSVSRTTLEPEAGTLRTAIFVDDAQVACGWQFCDAGGSNIGLSSVGIGTHTVEVRMWCGTAGFSCVSYGVLIVRVYPQ